MQFVAVLLIAIFVKLAYDAILKQWKNSEQSQNRKGRGEVIDLSNAWVDLNDMPYRKRDYLLNPRTLAAYHRLASVLGEDYVVLPRIRLVDLMSVSADAPRHQEYVERIKDRRVDFVICSRNELRPLLVILGCGPGDGKKKQMVDRFTRLALEAGELPYTSLDLIEPPEPGQLRNALRMAGLSV